MKCPDCGKELLKVRDLTEDERNAFEYFVIKEDNANQAINSGIDVNFKEGELYEYYKALYDQLAEARFLRTIFFRKIQEELNEKPVKVPYIFEGALYVHPVETKDEQNGNA